MSRIPLLHITDMEIPAVRGEGHCKGGIFYGTYEVTVFEFF